VKKVRSVNAFTMQEVKDGLDDCLAYDGPSVLLVQGLCVQISKPDAPSHVVYSAACIACGTCFRLGCPAIVKSSDVVEKTGRAKAEIDPIQCVGCDMCRQVCPASAIRDPRQSQAGAR
jgi:indolepyruvate ferredoxin oxidoreductase alpha subunit